jgi:hypothetical protein
VNQRERPREKATLQTTGSCPANHQSCEKTNF